VRSNLSFFTSHAVAIRESMPNPFPLELCWLVRKVRAHLWLHASSFVCLTLASLAGLVTPLSIRWLIDSILPARDYYHLGLAIALVFASYEGRAVFNALGNYLTFRAAQLTALELRASLLRHVDSLSADYYERTPVGELLYLFTDPIDEISYFGSDLLPSILRTIVSTVITLSAMAILNPLLTIVVAPIVPAFLGIRGHYRTRIRKEADAVQVRQTKFSGFLDEHLSSLCQIQLFRQMDSQERKAQQLLTDVVRSRDVLCRTGVSFSALSNLTIVIGLAAILSCGSLMVIGGKLTVGTLVAFYGLLTQLFDPLSSAMEMYSRAQRSFSSIRQIQAVTEIEPVIKNHPRARPLLPNDPLNVEFRSVSFGYRERRHLIDIPRLEILHGERVAIVGPNGAGKSTLGKLLARIYDVESGGIFIAGSDVRAVRLDSLRSSVCYVPPQPVMFRASIAQNLRIVRPETTDDELREALEIVGLLSLSNGDASGLDRCIGPGGLTLSSGERQRLAIARTLLQQPRIVIFDETTSSLDPIFAEAILRVIDRRMPSSTLIVVSHRVHSITWMGRILVLQDGRVVGDGSHSFLGKNSPLYTRLLASTASVD
jgi:ABC-type multidrug transport system fused ATPase/permease subunit